MRLNDLGEDALLAVSAMQRTILDRGITMCYSALDNTGDTIMANPDYDVLCYHAWTTNLHTGEVTETDLSEAHVVDMVEMDPNDVDGAIEEWGWCGALGATYGFPFVICPIGTTTCPADGVAFMRGQLVERG